MSKSTQITQLQNISADSNNSNTDANNASSHQEIQNNHNTNDRSNIDINSIMNYNNNNNNSSTHHTRVPNIRVTEQHHIPSVSIMTTSPSINSQQQIYDKNDNVQSQLHILQEELKNIKMQNDCPNGVCELKRPSYSSSAINYNNDNNGKNSTNSFFSFDFILNALNINDYDYKLFCVVLFSYFVINIDNVHSLIFNKIYDHLNNEYLILFIKSVVFTLIVLVGFKV